MNSSFNDVLQTDSNALSIQSLVLANPYPFDISLIATVEASGVIFGSELVPGGIKFPACLSRPSSEFNDLCEAPATLIDPKFNLHHITGIQDQDTEGWLEILAFLRSELDTGIGNVPIKIFESEISSPWGVTSGDSLFVSSYGDLLDHLKVVSHEQGHVVYSQHKEANNKQFFEDLDSLLTDTLKGELKKRQGASKEALPFAPSEYALFDPNEFHSEVLGFSSTSVYGGKIIESLLQQEKFDDLLAIDFDNKYFWLFEQPQDYQRKLAEVLNLDFGVIKDLTVVFGEAKGIKNELTQKKLRSNFRHRNIYPLLGVPIGAAVALKFNVPLCETVLAQTKYASLKGNFMPGNAGLLGSALLSRQLNLGFLKANIAQKRINKPNGRAIKSLSKLLATTNQRGLS